METIYIVDTHALIWYLAGDSRLGKNAKAILDSPGSELIIPAIVISESLFMISRGKTDVPSEKIWAVLTEYANVNLFPIDHAVLEKSEGLTQITEIHDRLIVSTALLLASVETETVVITKDVNIRESGLVQVIW